MTPPPAPPHPRHAAPALPDPGWARAVSPPHRPPATAPALLALEGLDKHHGRQSVARQLTLELCEGECLAVIGLDGGEPPGLLDLIGGELRPDAGRIHLLGEDLGPLGTVARARRGLARTRATPARRGVLSAYANTLSAATFSACMAPRQAAQQTVTALARCGLLAQAHCPTQALTPLQQRRLSLAQALATRPRVLLLGDLAAGLSAADSLALAALLQTLKPGLALIWSAPLSPALLAVADRLLVLEDGCRRLEGRPRALLRQGLLPPPREGGPDASGALGAAPLCTTV